MSGIVVLFGGTSSERMVACASAQHISSVLTQAECWFWDTDNSVSHVASQLLQDHQEVFTTEFKPKQTQKKWSTVQEALDEAKRRNLTIYLSLHGGDGENGWVQKECEQRGLAYTGSNSTASALAMDKTKAKERARTRGVKMAEQYPFRASDSSAQAKLAAFQSQFGSIVLKPANEGSSVGLSFINTADELIQWWAANQNSKTYWLAEEFLKGRELTIGVMMYKNCLVALPPSEVILERNSRFDYKGKYLGVGNTEITPADVTFAEQNAAQEVVLLAHTSLGCEGYTRSEVILTDRGAYYLETNTLPGLTKMSFIPQQVRAAGFSMEEFFREQIVFAERRRAEAAK